MILGFTGVLNGVFTMQTLREFFSQEDQQAILSAIREAESRTSGEIRVRIERNAGDNPMAAACAAFEKLGMGNTEIHNGVLFFLAIDDRQFVILGDDAINENVPKDFWEEVRDVVIDSFRKGLFAKGLAEGIKLAGEQLAMFFPYERTDINELPDAISFSDEGGG